jgi:hypothetical protein
MPTDLPENFKGTKTDDEPEGYQPPLAVRVAASLVICGIAGIVLAACVWVIAVILAAIPTL